MATISSSLPVKQLANGSTGQASKINQPHISSPSLSRPSLPCSESVINSLCYNPMKRPGPFLLYWGCSVLVHMKHIKHLSLLKSPQPWPAVKPWICLWPAGFYKRFTKDGGEHVFALLLSSGCLGATQLQMNLDERRMCVYVCLCGCVGGFSIRRVHSVHARPRQCILSCPALCLPLCELSGLISTTTGIYRKLL